MKNIPKILINSIFTIVYDKSIIKSRNQIFIIFQDIRVLHNIVDQVSERPLSKSTHLSGFVDDDDDDEGPKIKDILLEHFKEGIQILCIWDCCSIWLKIAELFSYLVFDPFTELFITLCIVVNVVFMALDHYDIRYDPNDPDVTTYM